MIRMPIISIPTYMGKNDFLHGSECASTSNVHIIHPAHFIFEMWKMQSRDITTRNVENADVIFR
jgi:hypothetical protein